MISRKRGASASVIASVCLLTALLQVVAAVTILGEPAGRASLSTADSLAYARIFLPLAFAVFLNLATGIAVYLMRIEALACLGCLLARRLALAVGSPVQLTTVLDVLLLLALLYFTMRLFQQSAARRITMLLTGLAVGHLTILLTNVYACLMLVSTGSKPLLVVLAALIGGGSLYAGVLAMRSHPQRARKFFLLAALVIGLTLPSWDLRYGFSSPFWLGLPVALSCFALTRRQTMTADQVSAH